MDYAYMSHPEEEPHLRLGSGCNITILTMLETSTGMAHAIVVNRKGDYSHPLMQAKRLDNSKRLRTIYNPDGQ